MSVDHRRRNIFMAEQFLDGADVRAAFQQVRGEGMPEGVTSDRLGQPGLPHGLLDRLLQAVLVDVMAADFPTPRIPGMARGGGRQMTTPFSGRHPEPLLSTVRPKASAR